MEYIKPMFLLFFVLGIVASVSSRHAAKHYPVEDAGNQEKSSLVNRTLKGQGSSLTSAFDFGEEKNKRKVSSISNVDDYSCSIFFELRNPDNGVYWVATENSLYIRNGKKIMEFPWVVPPELYSVPGSPGFWSE
ncbi:uncharacterized protein [Porites lutea]|uniref:uncharacterized protein isoform X2 n=1 Tax=Porites lutea TaxID=51062 RepID=UPI003CC61D5E